MSKRYIPTRARHDARRALISFSGLMVCVLLVMALISVASMVQASFITSPLAAVTNNIVHAQENLIKDNVASAPAPDPSVPVVTPIAAAAATNVAARVAAFPLEKAWPVRGRLTTFFSSSHPAIDIAVPRGTPLHPFATGIVVRASWWGSFGNAVVIDHVDGWETIYAHMDSIAVTVNQQVDLSTVIGAVGATGNATGPHVHFELSHHGIPVNPLNYLP